MIKVIKEIRETRAIKETRALKEMLDIAAHMERMEQIAETVQKTLLSSRRPILYRQK